MGINNLSPMNMFIAIFVLDADVLNIEKIIIWH